MAEKPSDKSKKRKFKFPFKIILYILTIVLVGVVVYENWSDMVETFYHLGETSIPVLLLLIPEQLFMYYACGQIFFSYLRSQSGVHKFTGGDVLSVSTELNFVTHAIPGGGIGGLAFLAYRLRQFGVSAGQSSFLYVFRYAVTTVINYFQAIVAIVILLAFNRIPEDAMWIIPVSLLMNMGILGFLWVVIYISSSSKRINFFARVCAKVESVAVRIVTFGHKKTLANQKNIEKYFMDIHESVKIAKGNKKYLKKPTLWGLVYSLCEIGAYWIVALALGRPELLPYIMVGEAIGSVFDGIVPYGLYELGMAGVMIALGVEFPVATIITVMTRVLTLLFTIVSGAIPYYKAIQGQKHESNS